MPSRASACPASETRAARWNELNTRSSSTRPNPGKVPQVEEALAVLRAFIEAAEVDRMPGARPCSRPPPTDHGGGTRQCRSRGLERT